MKTDPNKETYEQVSIFGKPALFTTSRLDRNELPDGVHQYDIRHSDEDGFAACEVKDFILVNHMGTIITKDSIQMDEHGSRMINDEDDFYFEDNHNITLQGYIDGSYQDKQMIDVVIVKPLQQPFHTKIENDLAPLQQQVNGYIQVVAPLDDNALLVCNEEGKIKGLPLNRAVGNDIIAGNFIIVGDDGQGNFCSLTDKQIDKYKDKFNDIDLTGYSTSNKTSSKNDKER